MIKKVFELATSKIKIEGTEVVAFPLFNVLNGKDSDCYVEIVEPSAKGGSLIAKELMNTILQPSTFTNNKYSYK